MDVQVPTATTSRRSYRLKHPLNPTDKLLIVFWGLLSAVSLGFHSRIQFWKEIVAANIIAAVLVWVLAYASRTRPSKALRCLHDWAAFPLVLFTYKQPYYMIGPIHRGEDYDQLLMWLDHLLFQVNPTEWLAGFSNRYLTEVLQITYSLFYVLFLVVGFELYRKDLPGFRYFRFTIVYGFLISYAAYFFLPAAGPRFTLHDFSKMDTELPGLLFTPALRWFINVCESIPRGVSNSVAMACAQRDVFPSGHVMMTLVAIVLAHRHRLKVGSCTLVIGILLIFATVYLRYHYLVDILAGALLAPVCLLTAKRVHTWFSDTR